MKRIDVYSPFENLWFNFEPYQYAFSLCASGQTCVLPPFEMLKDTYFSDGTGRSDITVNAESIMLSMFQERYTIHTSLSFAIAARSQFTKIKIL